MAHSPYHGAFDDMVSLGREAFAIPISAPLPHISSPFPPPFPLEFRVPITPRVNMGGEGVWVEGRGKRRGGAAKGASFHRICPLIC